MLIITDKQDFLKISGYREKIESRFSASLEPIKPGSPHKKGLFRDVEAKRSGQDFCIMNRGNKVKPYEAEMLNFRFMHPLVAIGFNLLGKGRVEIKAFQKNKFIGSAIIEQPKYIGVYGAFGFF